MRIVNKLLELFNKTDRIQGIKPTCWGPEKCSYCHSILYAEIVKVKIKSPIDIEDLNIDYRWPIARGYCSKCGLERKIYRRVLAQNETTCVVEYHEIDAFSSMPLYKPVCDSIKSNYGMDDRHKTDNIFHIEAH